MTGQTEQTAADGEETEKQIKKTARHTAIQWSLIGTMALGGGGFIAWALVQLASVSAANAQTSAQVTMALARQNTLEQRVETSDAGRQADNNLIRQQMQKLEEKMDGRFDKLGDLIEKKLSNRR